LGLKKVERLVYAVAREFFQFTEEKKLSFKETRNYFFNGRRKNFVINVNLINSSSCFRVVIEFRILRFTR